MLSLLLSRRWKHIRAPGVGAAWMEKKEREDYF